METGITSIPLLLRDRMERPTRMKTGPLLLQPISWTTQGRIFQDHPDLPELVTNLSL